MNRLKNQRVYLAGAMDRVADRGNGWRNDITPFLEKLGIIVFNPIKKPSIIGQEDEQTHQYKTQLKISQNYDDLSKIMRTIRATDLRLVDISDFLIVNLDLDIHPCGTYEEIFLANRSKKPVIVHMVQGKQTAPDWLFGTIPHQMIFSTWEDIKSYIKKINDDMQIQDYNRWKFFNI